MAQKQQRMIRPFKPVFYLIMDLLFILFSVLYIIGDVDHYSITPLRFAKPIPIWIMMAQLFTVRQNYPEVKIFIAGLAFGSLGDICLQLQQYGFSLFAAGAFSFLVGHIFYIVAFTCIIQNIASGKVQLKDILSYKPLFIIIWIIFLVFSFWNIGILMRQLQSDSIMMYVLPLYGTCLVLLVITALFFFFMSQKIDLMLRKAGSLIILGSILFYASDSFIAHGKYSSSYIEKVGKSGNAYIIMLTYYICQFAIGTASLTIADYCSQIKTKQIQSINKQNPLSNQIVFNNNNPSL